MEIKNEFLEKTKKLFCDSEFEDFKKSLNEQAKRGIVVNLNKIDQTKFEREFALSISKLPYGRACYNLNSQDKVGGDILHQIGAFYVQEPSAMIPGIILPIENCERVLDVCASPGGKTFQIARRLKGTLLSNEIDYARCKVLLSNVERLGLTNVVVSNFSTDELSNNYTNFFDAVIIDAPCSGEGMFRKENLARTQWSPEYVLTCAKMQREILDNVDKVLKVGGYIVYSTCTFSLEENEENIAYLADKGYEIQPIESIVGASDGVKIDGHNTNLCKRFYFHKSRGEGQFVALLKKTYNMSFSTKQKLIAAIGNAHKKLVVESLKEILVNDFVNNIAPNLFEKNDAVFYCPCQEMLVSDKILSYGVKLGTIKQNRFEPSHNLFTAFGNMAKIKIDLTKGETQKYLMGNTLDTGRENGWCALSYLGCFFAGGKIVNGLIKNHYPKGLRNY